MCADGGMKSIMLVWTVHPEIFGIVVFVLFFFFSLPLLVFFFFYF